MIRLLLVLAALALSPGARSAEPASFVGAAACAGCHASEAAAWRASHHAMAMQPATPATVVGDFGGVTLDHFGISTTLSRDGDRFIARTQGPDGAMADLAIAYTFGVAPLQQYLVQMPGGRLQALGFAWDTRAQAQGGQRWFQLYPDLRLKPGDTLHWTGRDQTWNYQCADCHSTDLQRRFDLAANRYATTWTDVNVSCEACHGPGSAHIAWARAGADPKLDRKGITAWLKATDGGAWQMNPETGIAKRSEKLVSGELDACASCHARRKRLIDTQAPGAPLLDTALPALLLPGLYHADGQIDGEVFEYGSFVQSRMHAAGVTCSNCHEPHTAKLRAEGNALCAQCHLPAKFDTAAHHHHETGGAGAQCASCHMPTNTYMIIDRRHDHSLRVPRPDLSAALGAPNACTQCHTDRKPDWAAKAVAEWFPGGRQTQPHFGTALQAGRTGAVNAERLLDALIMGGTAPGIARATALAQLPGLATAASDQAVLAAMRDPDPLVRAAAPRALSAATRPAGLALLSDPVRAVRVEAARALADIDPLTLNPTQTAAFAAATSELVAAELVDGERPEAHLNLGLLAQRGRNAPEAQKQYETALRLDPKFVPAMVNLADLNREMGSDARGEALLRQALAIEPDNADAHHSLGLLLIRQKRTPEGGAEIRRAAELAPDNVRYAYVYAVVLNSTGSRQQALDLLRRAHQRHPADWDVLVGMTLFARDAGDITTALQGARDMVTLRPRDQQAWALMQSLQKQMPR